MARFECRSIIMEKTGEGTQSVGWTEALGEHGTNPTASRTTGETLFALGVEWVVSSCENRIKAQFEQWVRANAKRVIAEETNPEEADALRSSYVAARGAGHYDWDGRYVRNARGDVPGLRYLLYLLLRRCQPEVTADQVAQMFRECPRDCGMVIGWSLGNFQPPVQGGNPKETPNP